MGGNATVWGGNGGDGGMASTGNAGAATSSGSWGSGNGDDGYVTGESLAYASASSNIAAFNQNIVMGANVLGNSVDTTMVGGAMNSTWIGDDDMS